MLTCVTAVYMWCVCVYAIQLACVCVCIIQLKYVFTCATWHFIPWTWVFAAYTLASMSIPALATASASASSSSIPPSSSRLHHHACLGSYALRAKCLFNLEATTAVLASSWAGSWSEKLAIMIAVVCGETQLLAQIALDSKDPCFLHVTNMFVPACVCIKPILRVCVPTTIVRRPFVRPPVSQLSFNATHLSFM